MSTRALLVRLRDDPREAMYPAWWLIEQLEADEPEPGLEIDLTCGEVGERFGISGEAIRRLCAQGRMPGAYKRGREWRIPRDAVTEYQRRQRKLFEHQEAIENGREAALGSGASRGAIRGAGRYAGEAS